MALKTYLVRCFAHKVVCLGKSGERIDTGRVDDAAGVDDATGFRALDTIANQEQGLGVVTPPDKLIGGKRRAEDGQEDGKRHDFAAPQCGNQNLGSKQQLDLKLRFLNRPARTRPLCLLEDAVCCVFE
jgi:hypothetical protein